MKLSEKLRQDGPHIIGRGTWNGVDPRTKAVPAKKGKGSYRRQDTKAQTRQHLADASGSSSRIPTMS